MKRIILSILSAILFSVFTITSATAQCGHVGIYYWGGSLKTTDSSTIIPTAKKLADSLHVKTIRITLACNDDAVYRGTGHCLAGMNLTALAQRADFNSIIADPQFTTVIITAYDWASFGDCATTNFLDTAFYTPTHTTAIETEFSNFANYLKTNFPSKQFILTNWEGDNQCYCGAAYSDPTCPSAPEDIAGFTKWMNARAAGINAAHASNVKVGIEICNIHSLETAGKPDILDTVVPYVYSDYVLYSSYESINVSPAQTASDIVFIRKKLAAFGKDSNNLLIGEMGFPAIAYGDSASAAKLQQIINVVNQYNIPIAIVWVLIDSPSNFGAYDSNGVLTAMGKTVKGTVCNTAGVNELRTKSEEVRVYPNPSNGVFKIQANSQQLIANSYIEVYNVLGEQVYGATLQPQTPKGALSEINISNQPNGVYIYRATSENGELIGQGRLVIER